MPSEDDVAKAIVLTHGGRLGDAVGRGLLMKGGFKRENIIEMSAASNVAGTRESCSQTIKYVKGNLTKKNVEKEQVEVLFIESNYRCPVKEEARTDLFEALLAELCNVNVVIGFSSTAESLDKAKTYFQGTKFAYASQNKTGSKDESIALINKQIFPDTGAEDTAEDTAADTTSPGSPR